MSEIKISLPADNETVKALVILIGTEMRAANQQGRYAAYIAEFGVTDENLNAHAHALAALITEPTEQKVDGKRTKFGNALNTAKTGLRRNMPKTETTTDPVLRVSLSGEGGGTTVIPADHPMYESLVALFAGE